MSVGKPLPHDSAVLHVTGQARYIDDIPAPAHALHLAFGLSRIARGRMRWAAAAEGGSARCDEHLTTPASGGGRAHLRDPSGHKSRVGGGGARQPRGPREQVSALGVSRRGRESHENSWTPEGVETWRKR